MSEPSDLVRVVFLGLVVLGVIAWTAAAPRLGDSLRGLGKWLLAAGCAGFALVFWPEIAAEIAPPPPPSGNGEVVELPRGPGGHYYATLEVDGTPVRFLVDTGATDTALTMADAARVGVNTAALRFDGVVNTANGPVRTAQARVEDVRLGDIVDPVLFVSIGEGDLSISLLGMSYLSRFDEITFEDGVMRLVR
ncbi:aspartyl protease family protein [Hasllibacter halocynthiae]|uniref:Aspartyl protease family protein n=1 Tax=Hasllibacter halocynthiae TaxID=595589 RepID=A0A2T0X7P6_9RHOB|nr:TIGR02281 family clan AA aspartic protease [Hasllibacter halocynthiae]PRY94959.1 aspartyl protease family protein [Hasllibacter halocynthiae]